MRAIGSHGYNGLLRTMPLVPETVNVMAEPSSSSSGENASSKLVGGNEISKNASSSSIQVAISIDSETDACGRLRQLISFDTVVQVSKESVIVCLPKSSRNNHAPQNSL